jgi:hypothetical protein
MEENIGVEGWGTIAGFWDEVWVKESRGQGYLQYFCYLLQTEKGFKEMFAC